MRQYRLEGCAKGGERPRKGRAVPALVRFDFRKVATEAGFNRLHELLAVALLEQGLSTARARLLLKIAEDLRESMPRPGSSRVARLIAERMQRRPDDAESSNDEAEDVID
jgi:hypothetical protein